MTMIMHPELMPFTEEQLATHFESLNASKFVQYYSDSIKNYVDYEKGIAPKDKYKTYRQAEKDERFHTARTFLNLFENNPQNTKNRLKAILSKAFGELPPFQNSSSCNPTWDDLMEGDLNLKFEKDLPAPKGYKEFLSMNLEKRHLVPYAIDAGTQKEEKQKECKFRKDLEGSTQVDAYICNESTQFKILIEAKYLSDISYQVSYDVTRNQIARNIDVMLENPDDRSLFVLLTPKYFKDRPHSRLYGYKMNEYLSNPNALAQDLIHRDNEHLDWQQVSKRIAWLTFEDFE